ncbi:LysE family translocator [Hyphococcus sp.]|uniref:LysE family translocator n=1 Tax=Hyphococcus sp. TaxID=2038636 RepID=UPI0020803D74|nr:MAG: threonine transporter RhtB [Marinicaulis sp.]
MLISFSVLIGFIATVLVIEATPGPNMGWLALVSASEGRKAGLAAVAGVGLGLLLIGAAAAAGLGGLVLTSPFLFQALRFGGAAYLLWLAYDAWRDAGETSPGIFKKTEPHYSQYFRRGVIINLLNPKAAVFYIVILPGFVDPVGAASAQIIILTILYVGLATLVHALIVIFAGAARPLLQNPERLRVTRRMMAVAIAAIAVWFAWSAAR